MAELNFKTGKVADKRKSKFNLEWFTEFPYIGRSQQSVGMAKCTLCVCDFSVASGGRTDVRRHVETARHQKMSETMVATKGGVGQYVAKGSNDIDGVTKVETMVAYRLAPQPPSVSRRRV